MADNSECLPASDRWLAAGRQIAGEYGFGTVDSCTSPLHVSIILLRPAGGRSTCRPGRMPVAILLLQ
jgi:hypothetical protein